jgi:hypothetical protein
MTRTMIHGISAIRLEATATPVKKAANMASFVPNQARCRAIDQCSAGACGRLMRPREPSLPAGSKSGSGRNSERWTSRKVLAS